MISIVNFVDRIIVSYSYHKVGYWVNGYFGGQMYLLMTTGSFDTYPNELIYRFNEYLAGLISLNHVINYDIVEMSYQLIISKNPLKHLFT